MDEEYYCTRMTLARLLIEKGHTVKIMPSIWDNNRVMWVFKRDADLEQTVTEYYHSIGKKSPYDGK